MVNGEHQPGWWNTNKIEKMESSKLKREETDSERAARKAAKKAKKDAKGSKKRAVEDVETVEEPVAKKHKSSKANKADAATKIEAKAPKAPIVSKSPDVLSPEEVVAWRAANEVALKSEDCKDYAPITSFAQASSYFAADILTVTKSFDKPSPIQAQCWPVLLDNRDVIGVAETGSGKTIGFLFPGIVHLRSRKSPWNRAAPGMLVCAPTRELAMQSAKVAEEVGSHCGFSAMCVFGGGNKYEQAKELKRIIHIVVATPGRLLDQISDNALSLKEVTYMVLDEADRMLDLGFEKDIRQIFSYLPEKRQTLLFTATWPESIQKIAKEFITSPVHVTIGSAELTANVRVTQIVEVIEDRARDNRLLQLLKEYHSTKKNLVLVFVLYKKEAGRVETFLKRQGYNCCAIHGDLSQDQRTRNFHSFKGGQVPLLIATDVAARGLDIPNVSHVINYSFPLTIEDYIHRIGRTGRAGKTGVSHTFFQDSDKARAGELQNVLRDAGMEVPASLIKFGSTVKRKPNSLLGNFDRPKGGMAEAKATKIVFDSDSDE